MFVSGFIFYGLLFGSYFARAYAELTMRPEGEIAAWPIFVAIPVTALIMAHMYPKGYEGGSPVGEGVRFGILMGVFFGVIQYLFYNAFPIPFGTALVGMVLNVILMGIGGLLIGLVNGRREAAE